MVGSALGRKQKTENLPHTFNELLKCLSNIPVREIDSRWRQDYTRTQIMLTYQCFLLIKTRQLSLLVDGPRVRLVALPIFHT